MDIHVFANPWEHIRLLSDQSRNEAMLEVVARHAPGKRVLEVGCGTGVISCIAAKLGATHVIGVEPTASVEVAQALVRVNRLGDQVEIREGLIEELEPEPMDFVFSEMLNAEPFMEGILSTSRAAARWVAPGGMLCPRRLRVFVALARVDESAREARVAQDQLRALSERHHLDLEPVSQLLRTPEAYNYVAGGERPAGPPVVAWDFDLHRAPEEAPPVEVELYAEGKGAVSGVILWFEAELDDETTLDNAPPHGGHWGQLVCAFAQLKDLPEEGPLRVRLEVEDELIKAQWI